MKRRQSPLPCFGPRKPFRPTAVLFLAFFIIAAAPPAEATGGWTPERWLDKGGAVLRSAPQFFWDIELKRLAAQYAEKDCPFHLRPLSADEESDRDSGYGHSRDLAARTAAADVADFEDALKAGRLKPADSKAALEVHRSLRSWLQARAEGAKTPDAPPGGEADSEFADYHRAAALLAQKRPEEAVKAWRALLDRPEATRHYRSVWAAFMLGKVLMLDAKTQPEAIMWFEKCRELAKAGFADSAGLAADSYGWQARAEYDSGRYPASARHYLQQLALGDTSAIASLKLLVPDRSQYSDPPFPSFAVFPPPPEPAANADSNGGSVPGPAASGNPPAAQTEPQPSQVQKAQTDHRLEEAARDEVLRQIVTAQILCSTYFPADVNDAEQPRLPNWLGAIRKAHLKHVEGAAALGWIAYNTASFDEAAQWAAMEKSPSPSGQWLMAKLALRKGDFAGAASYMAKVVNAVPEDEGYRYNDGYLPKASAAADLAAALLAQGKYLEAFAAFWKGGCWPDAAYLADRVLTTGELVKFARENASLPAKERAELDEPREEVPPVVSFRRGLKNDLLNLTGRRLIREGRLDEGREFLSEPIRKDLDRFQELSAIGADKSKPPRERAKSLFEAATLLRQEGYTWRGTEDDLDRQSGWYALGGGAALVQSRRTGQEWVDEDRENGKTELRPFDPAKPTPLFIPSAPAERKRLSLDKSAREPMSQHIRLAAGIARKAADLLPDNTEETADVLNQAGRWIQDLDNPAADKLYYQIEKRCPETAIGKAVIAKHWFIEPGGPWTRPAAESSDPIPPSDSTSPPSAPNLAPGDGK